jgi:hypothetical protein
VEAPAEGVACGQIATGDTIRGAVHTRKLISPTGSHTKFSTGPKQTAMANRFVHFTHARSKPPIHTCLQAHEEWEKTYRITKRDHTLRIAPETGHPSQQVRRPRSRKIKIAHAN